MVEPPRGYQGTSRGSNVHNDHNKRTPLTCWPLLNRNHPNFGTQSIQSKRQIELTIFLVVSHSQGVLVCPTEPPTSVWMRTDVGLVAEGFPLANSLSLYCAVFPIQEWTRSTERFCVKLLVKFDKPPGNKLELKRSHEL